MAFDSEFTRATFTTLTGPDKGQPVEVHFNPVSLQYALTNSLSRTGSGDSNKQHVSQSSAKLTMELVFDTTGSGDDVRGHTAQIARFMHPVGSGSENEHVPPVVEFAWGSYQFQGMVDSYQETLDFFAASGVPLRASVHLSMASQDKVFESAAQSGADAAAGLGLEASIGFGSPTAVASLAGNVRAGRAIAAANGSASLRFGAEGGLAVGGGARLEGPVAFASAGAGFSAGIGGGVSFGAGAGAGIGFGTSASASVQGGATAGASFGIGASASANVPASAGAFAGLRTHGSASSAGLATKKLSAKSVTATLATDSGASFRLGGRAATKGSPGLNADVGAGASLKSRIQFAD
jgi:hypothetical protein